MELNWVSLLTLVGLSQGALLAAVMASLPSGNRRANRLLAGLVGVLTLNLGVFFMVSTPVEAPYPFILFRLAAVHFWTGPLLYFYILLLVKPSHIFVWRDGVHFLAFPAAFLLSYFLAGPEAFQHLPYERLTDDIKDNLSARSALGDCFLLAYTCASLRLLARHRFYIEQRFSSLEKVSLQWLKVFVIVCLFMTLLSVLVELLGLFFSLHFTEARITSVFTGVLLLYGLGFMGLRQPLIFELGTQSQQSSSDSVERVAVEPTPVTLEKYERSGLGADDVERYWLKLQAHMATQCSYRTAGLKVGQLARELGMRDNYLSQVINSCSGKNFFEYINGYRLDEAKLRLQTEPDKPISEIALAVGFASQNAFNNQFKKHLQQTPSAYRKCSAKNNNQ